MPTLALFTHRQQFHHAPPAPPLVAARLWLRVWLEGVSSPFSPYVFVEPGSPFSVVSRTVASRLGVQPFPVTANPVSFEEWDDATLTFRPTGTLPAARLTSWRQQPCEFVTTSVQFRERLSGHLTAPLRLFAHCPHAPLPNYRDEFIILGQSFLRENGITFSYTAPASVGRVGQMDFP
jgi:hypothetical protein